MLPKFEGVQTADDFLRKVEEGFKSGYGVPYFVRPEKSPDNSRCYAVSVYSEKRLVTELVYCVPEKQLMAFFRVISGVKVLGDDSTVKLLEEITGAIESGRSRVSRMKPDLNFDLSGDMWCIGFGGPIPESALYLML
jgi:hypothetical protein